MCITKKEKVTQIAAIFVATEIMTQTQIVRSRAGVIVASTIKENMNNMKTVEFLTLTIWTITTVLIITQRKKSGKEGETNNVWRKPYRGKV